jgi:hypothetical protein
VRARRSIYAGLYQLRRRTTRGERAGQGILSGVANPNPESKLQLTENEKARYRAAISLAGGTLPCARCGAAFERMGLLPAKSPLPLFQLDEAIRGVQERQLHVVLLLCTQCGAVYPHSVGVLDSILQSEQPADEASDG